MEVVGALSHQQEPHCTYIVSEALEIVRGLLEESEYGIARGGIKHQLYLTGQLEGPDSIFHAISLHSC